MVMTTFRLICLRLYNITLGRLSFFSKILRMILLRLLVYGKNEKYVASSKYFDWKDLNAH